jgi:hypothetical protein
MKQFKNNKMKISKTMKYRIIINSLVVIIMVIGFTACSGDSAKDSETNGVDFLLVQNAEGVVLNDGELRLIGVAPTTLYFSDRPDRIVGRVTTQKYVESWGTGDNSFEQDPPNAVLSVLDKPEPQDITVILHAPRLDGDDLVYNVEVLDGNAAITGEASALFIDVVGMPLTPLSVAGVARRTTRRTVRRMSYR